MRLFRRRERAPGVVFGCAYCADEHNRYYEHVRRIATDESRGLLLLRCPECEALYEQAPDGGNTRRLGEAEAKSLFPQAWDPSLQKHTGIDVAWIMRGLAASAKLLAAEPEQQIDSVSGMSVDELALDFDNFYTAAASNDLLTTRQQQALGPLNRMLRDMSGEANAALWTEDSLREGVEWASVRLLAREAGAALRT